MEGNPNTTPTAEIKTPSTASTTSTETASNNITTSTSTATTTTAPTIAPGTSYFPVEEIIKGSTLIWNNKFDEADELFSKNKGPRFAVHYAESAFFKSFITADIEDTQAALDRLKKTRELAESHIKLLERGLDPADPQNRLSNPELINKLIDARIVLGDSLYLTAILQVSRDARIKGVFNLRKSWKVFEKCLKESKHHKDIHPELIRCLHFGAGFFLFAMSIIPSKWLKLVELAGFKADRDAGLHYIRETQKTGGVRSPFATMLLLFNNLLLPRGVANVEVFLQEADALIQESLKKFPTGSLFHVMGSHCARKQCDIDRGIKLMETALDNSKHLKQPPLIYRYELANCYCMTLNFQKAAELYAPLVEAEKFQVRTLCALQLATCYFMTNQREKALHCLARLQSFPGKKSQFDPIVIRQSKRYIANGGYFSAFELLYLRRDLAKMIPIMSAVLKLLEEVAGKTKANEKKDSPAPVEKKTTNRALSFGMSAMKNLASLTKKKEAADYQYDDRASYLLIKGSLLKAMNKNDEAIECYKEVIGLNDVLVEKLYVPYCMYELAECYYIKGQLKEAEEMFTKCSKISGYDWEDPLKIRLRVTMGQLKKGMAPPSERPAVVSIDALVSNSPEDDKEMEEPGSDEEEEKAKDLKEE